MSILLIYFLINVALCAIIDDEITYLPGWGSDLPSKQYSGMIEIPDTNRHYHYWFIESFGDPMNDPFVVWLNGGPGASGLLGYFLENGPFKLNELSLIYNDTDVPQLFLHNYTYSNIANVLYIESPAGVGFSWCFGYLGPYESCPQYNDSMVASDNYQLLKIFFEGFSEYMDHEFYLSGESYAGVYVTTLVMEIENNNNAGLPVLKGFILNNQCMGLDGFGGCDNDAIALTAEQLYGLGQMSHELYHLLWDVCGNSIIYGNYTNDKECLATLIYGLEYIGGFNVYDIYDTCVGIGQPNSVTKPHLDISNGYITMNSSVAYNGRQYFNKNDHPYIDFNKISSNSSTNPDSPYVCGGLNALNIYANNPTVKEYIHVPDIHWAMRDDTVLGTWPKYHKSQHDLVPYYKKWIDSGKYRIMVYYGDVDGAVPYIGGEQWTTKLGYNISDSWRAWTTDGKSLMAGYVQTFDTINNFTYVTVRGAGHLASQSKPIQTLKIMESFLNGKPLPHYNP